jgi:CspA family cold shock protein
MRIRGTVKAWHADRGYGFISPDDGGHDIFVHCREVPGYDHLNVGWDVEYSIALNGDRQRAINVKVLEDT